MKTHGSKRLCAPPALFPQALAITDADNFRIIGATLCRAYWAGASAYIDASFSNKVRALIR